jgi:PAS domain-containing protein
VVIEEEPLDTPHLGRRLMRAKKVPLRQEEGPLLHIVGVTEDITESRRTEKALRKSEERLARAIAAAARMGVWEWYVGTGQFNGCSGLEALYGIPRGPIRRREDVHAAITRMICPPSRRAWNGPCEAMPRGSSLWNSAPLLPMAQCAGCGQRGGRK